MVLEKGRMYEFANAEKVGEIGGGGGEGAEDQGVLGGSGEWGSGVSCGRVTRGLAFK
jgi:hypothetical protein